jgi:hypothetical protein
VQNSWCWFFYLYSWISFSLLNYDFVTADKSIFFFLKKFNMKHLSLWEQLLPRQPWKSVFLIHLSYRVVSQDCHRNDILNACLANLPFRLSEWIRNDVWLRIAFSHLLAFWIAIFLSCLITFSWLWCPSLDNQTLVIVGHMKFYEELSF